MHQGHRGGPGACSRAAPGPRRHRGEAVAGRTPRPASAAGACRAPRLDPDGIEGAVAGRTPRPAWASAAGACRAPRLSQVGLERAPCPRRWRPEAARRDRRGFDRRGCRPRASWSARPGQPSAG